MIQYVKTRQHFDIALMQQEVAQLTDHNWKAHYNTAHYGGNWSILPLRSLGGSLDNTISTHNIPKGISYSDTILLKDCPYLQSLIQSFECEKTSVRLMKLDAGANIKEHIDQDMNLEAGEARFHVPVITNADVAFYIMEDRIPMQAGECWYLNLSLPHRVHNAGHTDRIHLVIDCIVNNWVKELLDAPENIRKDITAPIQQQTFSTGDQQKIIDELRTMNSDAARQLITEIESGSNTILTNPHDTK
jgi:hypothetical protein